MTEARPVLVDTDVMVDFLRGNRKAIALVQRYSERIILSGIVAAELYAGVKGNEELGKLDSLLSIFHVAPVSADIARAGGLYNYKYKKSHGVGLADAIIAATVEAENADLKTLNLRHYPMIPKLKQAYVKK